MVHVGDLIVDQHYGYGIVLRFCRRGGEEGSIVHFFQPREGLADPNRWRSGRRFLLANYLAFAKLLSKSS
jgi:hypothetical protein